MASSLKVMNRQMHCIEFGILMILLSCNFLETKSMEVISAFENAQMSNTYGDISRVKRSPGENTRRLIPANYSIYEPPPMENGTTRSVDFYVLIVDVRGIDEVQEQLTLELNLQMFWKDSRLSHLSDHSSSPEFIVLNPILISHLWHPDIYIDHVIKVEQPNFIAAPVSLRIYPDSTIRYSARLTVVIACQMDFHYYPADTQRCNIDMKSYAYMSKILVLDWREGKQPTIKRQLITPNFKVGLGNTQNFSVETHSGSYSNIRFTIILRRYINFHLIQTYLPSALFVIVSFLSFLVAPENIPGRMTLCMTTLLTLTAMFASVKQNTPNMSYIKGLDIWMVTCIFFVFLTLLEYTILLKLRYLIPKESKRQKRKRQRKLKESSEQHAKSGRGDLESTPEIFVSLTDSPKGMPGHGGDSTTQGQEHNAFLQYTETLKKKYENHSLKVEILLSKIIPISFVIFNFIYWPWLFICGDYFNDQEFQDTNYTD